MSKPTVFFTPDITPENVVKMYELLGTKLPGKVAVKVHSGEDGNQNYLRPEFLKPIVKEVGLSSSATPPMTAHVTRPKNTRSLWQSMVGLRFSRSTLWMRMARRQTLFSLLKMAVF